MKTKHKIRLISVVAGVSLIGCGLVDGYNNFLPHLDAQWLLGVKLHPNLTLDLHRMLTHSNSLKPLLDWRSNQIRWIKT